MKRRYGWIIVGVVLAAAGLAAGCAGGKEEAANVVVAAVPCGQVGPFSEIATLFKKQNPDLTLKWTPENMVVITEKVVDGKAAPDAFLSMGDLEVDLLEKAGKTVEGTRIQYAMNALAITVPAENPGGVTKIEDLAKTSVESIAVPDPKKNSVGSHGIEALKGAGIWKQVEDKVLQPTYAADGKELGEKGQVAASIGYYPCVSEVHIKGQPPAKPTEIKMVGLVPADYYKEFWCEAVVVKGSKNPEGGKKLIEFLKTPEAQEIFLKWNFKREATTEK